jgi:hypothetical protein
MPRSTRLGTTEEPMNKNLMDSITRTLKAGTTYFSLEELGQAKRHALNTRDNDLSGDDIQLSAMILVAAIDADVRDRENARAHPNLPHQWRR